jgi:quinol-cytochrome oxidoreductase complex cytochrome b subunit
MNFLSDVINNFQNHKTEQAQKEVKTPWFKNPRIWLSIILSVVAVASIVVGIVLKHKNSVKLQAAHGTLTDIRGFLSDSSGF